MTNAIPYIMQGDNIILVVDNKSHTVSKDTHISYDNIVEALKAQDWEIIRELIEPKEVIINFSKGNITIEDNQMFWKGTPFHNALSVRIIAMFKEGFSVEPMVRFMENLMNNPSKTSVDELYGFLENNKLPITEDGHFLAYKKVTSGYLDIHSNSIDNSIGQRPSMDRNMVDDNRDNHCSHGFHFCSESYLECFGNSTDPVMILKINPADVVSIPSDYNGAKGRCWTYEVVGEVSGDPKNAFDSSVDDYYTPQPEPVTDDDEDDYDEGDEFGGIDMDNELDLEEEFDIEDDIADQSYDLVRINGDWVEYSGLTLDEARDRVAQNAANKKAALMIVHAGTRIEVK